MPVTFDRGITAVSRRHVTETKEISGMKCTRYAAVDTLDYGTAHVDARVCARVRARAPYALIEDGRPAGGRGGSVVLCRTRCTMQYTRLELPDRPTLLFLLSFSLALYLSPPPLFLPRLPGIAVHGCRDMGTVASSLSPISIE